MTERQQLCLKKFFEALCDAVVAAPENNLYEIFTLKITPRPSMAEFDECLRLANGNGWVIGKPSRVTKNMVWTISDAGRLAMEEL